MGCSIAATELSSDGGKRMKLRMIEVMHCPAAAGIVHADSTFALDSHFLSDCPLTRSPRIAITRPLPGDPVKLFSQAGFTNIWINTADERLARPALLEAVKGAEAILATPADVLINTEFFDAAGPQLKIVSNYAVGVDNIDLNEAKRRGVIVAHTPNAVTEPTADIAWLLLLGAAKRAGEGERLVRSGTWKGVGPNEL